MMKRLLGKEHPDIPVSLNNLAFLYHAQGRYSEAEPLYMLALEMRRRLLGLEHPDVVASSETLAHFCRNQGRVSEQETF